MGQAIRAAVAVDASGLAGVASAAKQRSITLKAVKAGAKPVVSAAKAVAPRRKRSGALKQSLGVKAVKGTRGKTLSLAVIGPRKRVVKEVPVGKGGRTVKAVPANYAHLVELGTRPHALGKGSKLVRKDGRRRKGDDSQHGATHPGAKPHPFLGKAFDATKDRARQTTEQVMTDEVMKLIGKEAAKLRTRGT